MGWLGQRGADWAGTAGHGGYTLVVSNLWWIGPCEKQLFLWPPLHHVPSPFVASDAPDAM